MKFEPNITYHIFNQGNNQRKIFFERADYLFFLKKMRKHLLPFGDMLCYCLMPNHFHWLIQIRYVELPMSNLDENHPRPELTRSLNHSIGILLRSYTRSINKKYNWSGSLFRNDTKAKEGIIHDFITVYSRHWNKPDYIAYCFNYIHQNPVKAKLVKSSELWEFSSALDYTGIRKGTLCNQQLAREMGLC